MSTLREELLRYKEKQQQILDEAAVAWVEQNIILLNERLNRTAVSRLVNSITRFDEKFGAFKDKLPAIQSIIDNAESGLQLVLTGKTSETRATDMLRNLSLVYSLLSDFFSGDLPALLRTPIFKAAKEAPEMRLDSISGPKYDPTIVVSAFANALRPSKDELKMMGKIYKNIPMPQMNADEIAKQLLTLSYSELMKLTETGKVPMIAVPNDLSDEGSKVAASTPSAASAGATESVAAPAPVVPPAPGAVKENVSPKKDDPASLLEQEKRNSDAALLLEAPDLAAINKAMADLDGLFQRVPDLKASPLYNAVTGLRKQAQQAAGGTAQGRIASFLSGGGGIGALVKDPAGRVIAQAQMAIDMFKKLGETWPKISNLFSDGVFDAEDQKQLFTILTRELQGGAFKQLKSAFGVKPYQGLDINDIVRTVVEIAARNNNAQQPNQQQQQQQQQVTTESISAVLKEDIQDITRFFKDLNTSFKPQPTPIDNAIAGGAGGGTAQGPGVGNAQGTKTTGQAGTTTGSRPGQPAPTKQNFAAGKQSTAAPAEQQNFVALQPNISDEQLKSLTRVTGVEPDRLRKLAQTRGIRVTVNPSYLRSR